MNYKQIILNKLLNKYEKSKSYVKDTNRRIMIKAEEIKEYNTENYEQKILFHEILKELKTKGLIDFNYLKYEEGNILDQIWLEKENIDNSYLEIQRDNPKKGYMVILNQLKNINFEQMWLQRFCEEMKSYMEEKQKQNSLLPVSKSKSILIALQKIDNMQRDDNVNNMLKRLFSIQCYNDSKYFEKEIEKYIINITKKYYFEEKDNMELNDDEILKEFGIVKYPEIIEFCGNMKCNVKGKGIEFSDVTFGSYINSETILNMKEIELIDVDKIIWIENKANYIDYISKKNKNEFVIYHGGFYSPIKGEFFKKIYQASKKVKKEVVYLHWSDIDIGGFKIFNRLKNNIVEEVEPYKMDKNTLLENKDYWNYFDESYKKKLCELKNCDKYQIFFDTIDVMIEYNCKLEQEVLISKN